MKRAVTVNRFNAPCIMLLALLPLMQCTHRNTGQKEPYPVKSYLGLPVDSIGNPPANPYVIRLKEQGKELWVVGILHSRDTLNPAFDSLENMFRAFKPDLVMNEGGTLDKRYPGRKAAIAEDGELGLEKYLAGAAGTEIVSGDEPFKQEFGELSQAFSREEALVYYATERFVIPYASGQYSGDLETQYQQQFIRGYIEKEGIRLAPAEKTFAYYEALYQKFFHKPLSEINQDDFNPISRTHYFCGITRKSKMLRDQYLLQQIAQQLRTHRRIMVVYGAWHVLAIEPALRQVMDNAE